MKVKVYTGIEQETFDKVKKRAEDVYDGNFSLCLRLLIEKGLESVLGCDTKFRDYDI